MDINILEKKTNNISFCVKVVVMKSFKGVEKSIKKVIKAYGFSPKEGNTILLNKVLYVGVNSFKSEDIKIAFSNAIQELNKTKYKK